MIPSPPPLPIPNVLFQGKNSASPNVWPGGELVHGDKNRARLDDNKIVSACSYGCVCPTGAAREREGMLGWEDHGRRVLLLCMSGPGVLRGMYKQPQNEKCPLEVELGVWEIKHRCR